jgi:hypothetical protein
MSGHSVFETHRVYIDAADMAQRIAAGLALDGLVTFECDPERDAMLALALRLLIPSQHRDADPDGITLICDREALARRRGYAGFGCGELELHTELSSAPRPPALLMLFCARAASSGGASLIADGACVYADLADRDPGAAMALACPGTALFGEPGRVGAVFESELDGWLRVRLRLDDLASFSPDARQALPRLREVIARHMAELPLTPGQGFLIDNARMLHGRRPFTGSRAMYRILGHPAPGLVLRPGFHPAPRRLSGALPDPEGRPARPCAPAGRPR